MILPHTCPISTAPFPTPLQFFEHHREKGTLSTHTPPIPSSVGLLRPLPFGILLQLSPLPTFKSYTLSKHRLNITSFWKLARISTSRKPPASDSLQHRCLSISFTAMSQADPGCCLCDPISCVSSLFQICSGDQVQSSFFLFFKPLLACLFYI